MEKLNQNLDNSKVFNMGEVREDHFDLPLNEWNESEVILDLAGLYRDLYKSFHGVKFSPSCEGHTLDSYNSMMKEDHERWVIDAEIEAEESKASYEAEIAKIMGLGASSREQAIQWLVKASISEEDLEYYGSDFAVYSNGWPYEVEEEVRQAMAA